MVRRYTAIVFISYNNINGNYQVDLLEGVYTYRKNDPVSYDRSFDGRPDLKGKREDHCYCWRYGCGLTKKAVVANWSIPDIGHN